MKDSILKPILARMGDDFDPKTMNDYLRRLDLFFNEILSRGKINVTTINANGLPGNGNNLRDYDFFLDGDTIKVVLPNTGYAPSYELEMSLGSVTIEV